MVRTSYLLNLEKDLLIKTKVVCLIEETNMKTLINNLLEDYVSKYDIPHSKLEEIDEN